MLVLTREVNESIVLRLPDGRTASIMVVHIKPGRIRLGVVAPDDVKIERPGETDTPVFKVGDTVIFEGWGRTNPQQGVIAKPGIRQNEWTVRFDSDGELFSLNKNRLKPLSSERTREI